jgi:hypothetical protein
MTVDIACDSCGALQCDFENEFTADEALTAAGWKVLNRGFQNAEHYCPLCDPPTITKQPAEPILSYGLSQQPTEKVN